MSTAQVVPRTAHGALCVVGPMPMLLFLAMVITSTATSIPPPPETNWFHNAGRGVFTHYLNGLQNNKGPNSLGRNTSWSDTVDEFDVDAYADSAARAGARYAVITMMQGGIHMIAPNSRYNNYIVLI